MEYLADPFIIFKIYCAVKAHMSGYFLIKNGYKDCFNFRMSKQSFNERTDNTLFRRFAQDYTSEEAYKFFIAQFCENSDLYSFTITKEIFIAKEIYKEWLRRIKNLRENYVKDCFYLLGKYGSWKNTIKDQGGNYPALFTCMLKRTITFETFSWLAYFFKLDTPGLYPNLIEQSAFETLVKKYMRYRYLLEVPKEEIKRLTPRKLGDNISI